MSNRSDGWFYLLATPLRGGGNYIYLTPRFVTPVPLGAPNSPFSLKAKEWSLRRPFPL